VKDQQTTAGAAPNPDGQARHGYRNEMNWEGGSGRHEDPPMGHAWLQGRQPYGNQTPNVPAATAGEHYAVGNRAERSGRNLDQLESVKRKP
jgi:hypothetical protein